jgi:ATP sulfurylase
MTEIVTASRRVAHRALHYLMKGTLNMMKGLILFALMVCVVK